MCFFFFQAEDGIRDWSVTGVQTCALPIYVAEMDRAQGREPGPTMKDRGEKPWHFVKTSKSSVVGPGAKVKLPAFSKAVDWEVELAAVIGKRTKDVSVDKALDCVAGYTIANDLSAREV